jgi:hypothetical protein
MLCILQQPEGAYLYGQVSYLSFAPNLQNEHDFIRSVPLWVGN